MPWQVLRRQGQVRQFSRERTCNSRSIGTSKVNWLGKGKITQTNDNWFFISKLKKKKLSKMQEGRKEGEKEGKKEGKLYYKWKVFFSLNYHIVSLFKMFLKGKEVFSVKIFSSIIITSRKTLDSCNSYNVIHPVASKICTWNEHWTASAAWPSSAGDIYMN